MTFLSFFLAFVLLAVPHGVLDSKFKLCAFVVDVLIKGEIEKPSGQYLGLIMMVIDIPWFEFKSGIFQWFLPLSLFVWRITFACLVMCR
jgi:hypothetical protein